MTDFDDICRHGEERGACSVPCANCGHGCGDHDASCEAAGCDCVAFLERKGSG